MRNNTTRNQEITELGKEFWGILLFETTLKGLYDYLKLNRAGISLITFANWTTFPEYIPPDIRQSIRLNLINRYEDDSYNFNKGKEIEETEEERLMHNRTNEFIRFKYHNRSTSPQSYQTIYQMPSTAFKSVLSCFNEAGWTDNETLLNYFEYYRNHFDYKEEA